MTNGLDKFSIDTFALKRYSLRRTFSAHDLRWYLRNHVTAKSVNANRYRDQPVTWSTYIVHMVVNVWYSLPTTSSSSFIPETYAFANRYRQ